MALGKRVKEQRESLGLTQGQLAEKIGRSQTYIQSLESRDSKKTDHSHAISQALGVSHDWLITGEGSKYLNISSTGSHHEPSGALRFNSVDFALQSLAMVKDYPAYKEKSKDTDWLARAFIALYEAHSDDTLRNAEPAVILKLVA